MEEKEIFIEQEKKFLKELLEKYRIENPKEEINFEEEIKRIDEEMKRMEEEDPASSRRHPGRRSRRSRVPCLPSFVLRLWSGDPGRWWHEHVSIRSASIV